MRGYSRQIEALIEAVTRTSKRSSAALRRQKPTRMPYSCQAQLGTSGSPLAPAGVVMTWRGMRALKSQFSTLTTVETTTRASPGSLSGLRSTIAE